MERKNFGYTLIELMVVLAIIGFIAAVAFYGLRSYNDSQKVINAQKDFVNLLRSTQNKVTNGANGAPIWRVDMPSSGNTYTIYDAVSDITTPIQLSNGVSVNNSLGTISLCFVNSNLSLYDNTVDPVTTRQLHACGSCFSGSGFVCNSGTASSPSPYQEFSFTYGSTTKHVRIEGSGMTINRIYASD